MADLYNQFFGTIGYDAFRVDPALFVSAALSVICMALLAHTLAGLTVLLRGRIA